MLVAWFVSGRKSSSPAAATLRRWMWLEGRWRRQWRRSLELAGVVAVEDVAAAVVVEAGAVDEALEALEALELGPRGRASVARLLLLLLMFLLLLMLAAAAAVDVHGFIVETSI